MYKLLIAICALFIISGCTEKTSNEAIFQQNIQAELIPAPAVKAPEPAPISIEISEPTGKLSLKDALSLTLLKNSDLKAFSYEVRAAEARQIQAGSWTNPELIFEMEDFGGTGDFSDTDSAETTILLSQLIQLGDKVNKSRIAAGYSSSLAEMDYKAKKLDIYSELSQSFVELLYVQDKMSLSLELINLSEETLDSVSKRVQAGRDAPLDLSKAKIDLAQTRIDHIEVTKMIGFTRKKLASFWDDLEPGFTVASGNLAEISKVEKI
jgi:cobalt-zinc-cadmium efflux system outer membrane protein